MSKYVLKNNLQYIRETLFQMEQLELAKIMDVRALVIDEIEKEQRIPSLITALEIAKALNCKVDDIFFLV